MLNDDIDIVDDCLVCGVYDTEVTPAWQRIKALVKAQNTQSIQSLCDNCQRFGCKFFGFKEHYIFISKCNRWARRD
jgi:hypothetical protein